MSIVNEPTISQVLLNALWLVNNHLLDQRCRDDFDDDQAMRICLTTRVGCYGAADERTVQRNIERFLGRSPNLLSAIDEVGARACAFHHGLPMIKAEVETRQLMRVIDPDLLICLSADFRPSANDYYDWCAVPLRYADGVEPLLKSSSVDTHIHLGGALPPLFYWMALMSCHTPVHVLAPDAENRGFAEKTIWIKAISRAIHIRYQLAGFVNSLAVDVTPVFPLLAAGFAWHAEQPIDVDGLPYAAIRDEVLAGNIELRLKRQSGESGFCDPLADAAAENQHYAAGERRLLCAVNAYLRSNANTRDTDVFKRISGLLLDYLRIRNAFHQAMVHDFGADGLMRFIETFGRRRFKSPTRKRSRRVYDNEGARLPISASNEGRARRLRKRYRQQFRGIELRVSIPEGRLFKPVMKAWLSGVRNHLRRNECFPCFATQAAFLFHLIKKNDSERAFRDAQELSRKLAFMLKDHPGLRPFIIGLDAAGDERSAAPRTFGEAFRYLRDFEARHRIPSDQPDIHLGWTYHVGEDVDDLLTGLRHMDEAASLLLDGQGGRLGHALILGDSPRRFYDHRGGVTEPYLGCHLLDLVWAYGRLITFQKPKWLVWIQNRVELLANQDDIKLNMDKCFQAMHLDDGEQVKILRDVELLAVLLPGCDAERMMKQPVSVIAEQRWLKMLKYLQTMLRRERFAYSRLCIEANPTSNLLIGQYSGYEQLPYPHMVDDELALSLNTDDPGLFMTTLPGEYSAMYHALAETMSHRKALKWLAARVFDARQSSFIGAQTPIGNDFPLQDDAFERLFFYLPGSL